MPRIETVISVFVASPSDTEEERSQIDDVVEALNIERARESGVRIEVIKWENYAFPGIGEDAQDVINTQLPDDCDVFVGILKGRFGTPTQRAQSGTEEEFRRALERHESGQSYDDILFYFGSGTVQTNEIDDEVYEQIKKVSEFRKRLDSLGILYWNFSGLDDFSSSIRLHLTRVRAKYEIQNPNNSIKYNSHKNYPITTKYTDENTDNETKTPDEYDHGFIDLAEEAKADFKEGAGQLQRFNEAVVRIGEQINVRAEELSVAQGADDRSMASRILVETADEMSRFSDEAEEFGGGFSLAFQSGIRSLIRAYELILVDEITPAQIADAEETILGARELLTVIAGSIPSISSLRENVQRLPRAKRELNRAKRKTVEALEGVEKRFSDARADFMKAESV